MQARPARSAGTRASRSALKVASWHQQGLPNEAVRAAVAAGAGISALSRSVVEASLADGQLVALPFDLPAREFLVVGAVQRHVSRAADAFLRHLIPDQGA